MQTPQHPRSQNTPSEATLCQINGFLVSLTLRKLGISISELGLLLRRADCHARQMSDQELPKDSKEIDKWNDCDEDDTT